MRSIMLCLLLGLPLAAQTPIWTHCYNGPGGAWEAAEAVCRDSSGNIYLAGGDEERIIVVSVTPEGTERWHYHYSGYDGYNSAWAITCDPAGNVYVAGSIGVDADRSDFGVIALSSTGAFRWDYHCNGTNGWDAGALVIELGPDGNIYACGYTEDEEDFRDITVVSLTPAGSERWRWDYDAGFHDLDEAYDLAIGLDSNVYICGTSRGSDTTYLDLTVLSLTLDGHERWINRYMPPSGGYDVAQAIAIGTDNRVYVAGATQPVIGEYQWCVACFDSAGSLVWVFEKQPYPGYNMAQDIGFAAGRLFSCGTLATADHLEDMAVVCIDTTGHEVWTWTYDGSAHLADIGWRLIVDSTGSATVAGMSYTGQMAHDMVCASLTPGGSRRWLFRSSNPVPGLDAALSLTPAPAGGVYCVGIITDSIRAGDFALIRFDANGSPLWTFTYDSGVNSGADGAWCAAVAPDGTSCIAGSAHWGSGYQDFALVSLDPAGTQRWQYHLNGAGGTNDIAYSVAYGDDGNWYAAGHAQGADNNLLFTVVSVDNSGQERWVWHYGLPETYSFANWVAVGDNRIYACGSTSDSLYDHAFTVTSFTQAGSLNWLFRLPNQPWGGGFAFAVSPTPDGSIWATGRWTTPSLDDCQAVVKLTANGTLADTWVLDPPYPNYGLGIFVAPGPDGNIYVCGFDEDSLADWFTVASFTPSCSLRWLYIAPEPGIATSIAFGEDSTIYVSGSLFDPATFWDLAIVALTPEGNRLWKRSLDGGLWDIAYSIAVGEDSSIYAAGVLYSLDDKEDFTLACLAPDGSERWVYRTRGSLNQGNCAYWATPGLTNTVLVTGAIHNRGTWDDMFTALFSSTAAIAEIPADIEYRWLVPSHCRSVLAVRVPRLAGPATIRLFDVTGRIQHEERIPALQTRLNIDTRSLPAGSYFVRLEAPDRVLTGRTLKFD